MPHNISCKIYFPPVALGQDINMQFFLTNTGQQEYPGGVAEVHKGDYFQYSSATVPKIASGREVKIAMKIPVYEVKSVHKIPSDITLTLSEGFSKKNHHFQIGIEPNLTFNHSNVVIEFGKYAAGLLHYKKPSQEPLVVLCCGMQGATKSSFITSTYKMIKRDAKAKAAIEGNLIATLNYFLIGCRGSLWGNNDRFAGLLFIGFPVRIVLGYLGRNLMQLQKRGIYRRFRE